MSVQNVSYQEFKEAANEFFNNLREDDRLTTEQAQNGFKMLGILFLNGADNWSVLQNYQANMIINIASEKLIDFEFRTLIGTHHDQDS